MNSKEIVLIKETRQKEYIKKVMDTISPYLTLKPSDKVAIKINLSGSRELYANTNYAAVESLTIYLKDNFGVSDFSVIEGSDGGYYSGKTTWDIFYKFKYKAVELNGGKLVNLDELPHDFQLEVRTKSGVKQVSYTKYETDYMISLTPPKTHNLWLAGLTIPNMIGFVKPEDRHLVYGTTNTNLKNINDLGHGAFRELQDYSAKNFAALLKELRPSLAIIDGLYGMEGKGPVKGSPVFHGFSIASEDVVLADALTAFVMGFDVDRIPYITAAHNEGLGEKRWQHVKGVDPGQVKFPYRAHPYFQKHKTIKNNYQKRYDKDNDRSKRTYHRGRESNRSERERSNNERDNQ
ncbi:MAG: DUF362 domain-containing protein [bacterium]|nr:DUF362 domain-containing protein [bacterium]